MNNNELLLTWFNDKATSFFEKFAPENFSMLQKNSDSLRSLLDKPKEFEVCFLGDSAIGKSTLINALVAGDRMVLPAGGVGALTALATEVKYSENPFFSVHYHDIEKLRGIRLSLEKPLATQRKSKDSIENNQNIKQAQLLITGHQSNERTLEYLVDGIRCILGEKIEWGSEISDEDIERINNIKNALNYSKEKKVYECFQSSNIDNIFDQELSDHVSGFLAPLVKKIQLGWNSDILLNDIVIVDLPGVGVADDSYQKETINYISNRAHGLVLVTNKSGLTQDACDLLRTSGYLKRLIGTADDFDSDFCPMMMAVTHVDALAGERFSRSLYLPKGQRPKKSDIFKEISQDLIDILQPQAKNQLEKHLLHTDVESINVARTQVRDRLLQDLRVYPVSAPEYRKLRADDEEDRPFLTDERQSGIPILIEGICDLASRHRELLNSKIDEARQRLIESLCNELSIVHSTWSSEQRVAEELEKLREELNAFLEPKQREYDTRLGSFREFLEATVEDKIAKLVEDARRVAEKELNGYLRGLKEVHWATLRAAARRKGTWIHGNGRAIDLPNDIAGYFQEPMAAVWSQELLVDIRKRTGNLGKDISAIVSEIVEWAKKNAGDQLQSERLELQKRRVEQQMDQLNVVGREAVDELRQVVKGKLFAEIYYPIQKKCDDFVMRGDDCGRGVRDRILELFENLAEQATHAVRKPAQQILKEQFIIVKKEIEDAFSKLGDPPRDTSDIMVL